jgi:hypothetical protein
MSLFDSAIFDSVIFDTAGAAPVVEDDNARRALEHYRLNWLARRRREEDEDDAWLVLQR